MKGKLMRKKSKILLLVVFVSIFSIMNIFPVRSDTILYPTADTYVSEYYSTTNYGGESYIYVEKDSSGWNRYGYFTFDLSSISDINRAYFYINIRSLSATANISLYNVPDDSWGEYSINWNDQPSHQPICVGWDLAVSDSQWLMFNLTTIAKMNTEEHLSLFMESSSIESLSVYTKEENNEDRHPHLIIDPEEQTNLSLDQPEDKTIFHGTTGNYIIWNSRAISPDKFNITRNGVLLNEGVWNGLPIFQNIDGFEVGSHIFTLFINDTDGNTMSDSLIVNVVTSLKLIPDFDTYTFEYYDDSNYGGSEYFYLEKDDSGWNREGYLKFTIPNTPIDNAFLHLFIRSISATANISIYHIPDNTWNEYTLTWNNKPSYLTKLIASDLAISDSQLLTFNISEFVNLHNGQTISLLLLSSCYESLSIYSKEESNEDRRPYLSINPEKGSDVLSINSPSDKTIYYNTNGNSLIWETTALFNALYNVTKNNVLIKEGSLSEPIISLNLDRISIGDYVYIISLIDSRNNTVSDTVNINCRMSSETKVPLIADTYTFEYYDDSNYGGSEYFYLEKDDSGWNREGYLKIELPNMADLTYVYLNMYVRSLSATANITLYYISDNSWDENFITWNKKPNYSGNPIASDLAITDPQWLVFDITDLVKTYSGEISLKIQSSSYESLSIYTKEESNEDRHPYLNISGTGTYGPKVTLSDPVNQTYIDNDVYVDFTVNTTTSWVGYSLDGNPNVTVSDSFTLIDLPDGIHSIVMYAADNFGNIAGSDTIWFTIDTPVEVIILFPKPITYATDSVWLNYTYDEPPDWIGYSLDGNLNMTLFGNTVIDSLTEGIHTLTIFVNDTYGTMTSFQRIFSIDTQGPVLTILNPENTTYTTDTLHVEFDSNEPLEWSVISLDNNQNISIGQSGTWIVDLEQSTHTITLYAQDLYGNEDSIAVQFTVDLPPVINLITPPHTTIFTLKDIWINYTINEEVDWIDYYLDDDSPVQITDNYFLENVSEGEHTIQIRATDVYGNIGSSNLVSFTIDTLVPVIYILNPQNTTYTTNQLSLEVSANEDLLWIVYSLNNQENKSFSYGQSITFTNDGNYSIVFYACDLAGHISISEKICFSIIIPIEPTTTSSTTELTSTTIIPVTTSSNTTSNLESTNEDQTTTTTTSIEEIVPPPSTSPGFIFISVVLSIGLLCVRRRKKLVKLG